MTPEELKKAVIASFSAMDATELEDLLSRSILAATLYGKYVAGTEAAWPAGQMPAHIARMDITPLPFDEAIKYWQGKIPITADEFWKLADESRALAFSYSGGTRLEMVQDVYDAIDKVLEQGLTLEQFRDEIGQVIEDLGWPGYRSDMIFRTNVLDAYNAGRHKQQTDPAILARRPYWQFVATAGACPVCQGMHLKIYPADDPFWDTWYPELHPHCMCSVRTLSVDELDEFGLSVETEDITGKLFQPEDPETGAKLPPRPLMPPRGWGGAARFKQAWNPDLSKYSEELRQRFEEEQARRAAA